MARMPDKLNILVAGATGYLGRSLCSHLRTSGHSVVAGTRSNSSHAILPLCQRVRIDTTPEILSSTLRSLHIDMIVQCMCCYGRANEGLDKLIEGNLVAPINILEAAKLAAIPNFINIGTSLPANVSKYALAKDQFAQWLALEDSIDCRLQLRLEQFYGPHASSDQFITWTIKQLLSHTDALELTRGEQIRDLIYIDDLLSAISTLIDNREQLTNGLHCIDVGSSRGYQLREVVSLIRELCGSQATLNFGAKQYRENEVMHSVANTHQLLELGWKSKTDLRTGLVRCIESMRNALDRNELRKVA
jgi:CDP-paratose synthetase